MESKSVQIASIFTKYYSEDSFDLASAVKAVEALFQQSPKAEALKPSPQLLIKLGSLIVHYEEYISKDGHPMDKIAIDSLSQDKEVVAWIAEMSKLALLPLKRNDNGK